MSWLLALLLTASALAQDSNDPFGDAAPTEPATEPASPTDPEPEGAPEPPDDLPPWTPWAEALVKQEGQACVSIGELQSGWNALSATVRRPTCAVVIKMTVVDEEVVHYDVIASVTGRYARVVGSWTLKARRGQRAFLEQKGGRQDWLRIEIRPER